MDGPYFSKLLCYNRYVFLYIYIYIYSAIKLFKLFKFLIFLKETIMIIKNNNKIALNITQIIDRHIQMYIDNIF